MNHKKDFYWTTSKCSDYFFLIAPFGYGSKIAAENFAKKIGCSLNKWIDSNQIPEIIHCNLLFNFGVTNFNLNTVHCKSKIWIDCLLWMRKNIKLIENSYDYILAENFFNLPKNDFKNDNLIIIPPLSDFTRSTINNKSSKIVISFGGVETPFTTDFHRFFIPFLTISSAISILKKHSLSSELIVCIPSHLIDSFKQKYSVFKNISFVSPSQQYYLKIIENADKLILQPGLYGPFEAFYKEIPTYFVPPFSYTQLMQAIEFEKNELLYEVPLFNDLKKIATNYIGDIDIEEENCFTQLEKTLLSIDHEKILHSFNHWMENIIFFNNIIALTQIRLNFVKKSIARNNKLELKDFIINLNNK